MGSLFSKQLSKHYLHYYCTKIVHAVPDPCRTLPCDENAICTREGLLSDNFICECQPPFTVGNGFDCSSR